MASGNLCLLLSEEVDWNEFPEFTNYVINILNAKIEVKHESVESAIWKIIIDRQTFRLVFDDYPQEVTIESMSEEGNKKLLEIFEILKKAEYQ